MLCPGCSVVVQKDGGCDYLKCKMCEMEICWPTRGPRRGPKVKYIQGDTYINK